MDKNLYLLFQYKLGCVITKSFNRCEDSLYSSYISVQYALSDEYFSEYVWWIELMFLILPQSDQIFYRLSKRDPFWYTILQ